MKGVLLAPTHPSVKGVLLAPTHPSVKGVLLAPAHPSVKVCSQHAGVVEGKVQGTKPAEVA